MPCIGQHPIFGFLFYFIFVSSSFDSCQPLGIDFFVCLFVSVLYEASSSDLHDDEGGRSLRKSKRKT